MNVFSNHQKPKDLVSFENDISQAFLNSCQEVMTASRVKGSKAIKNHKQEVFYTESAFVDQQELVLSGKHLKGKKTLTENDIDKRDLFNFFPYSERRMGSSVATLPKGEEKAFVTYAEGWKIGGPNRPFDISYAMNGLSNIGLLLQMSAIGALSYPSDGLISGLFSSYQAFVSQTVSQTDHAVVVCISVIQSLSLLAIFAKRNEVIFRRKLGNFENCAGKMAQNFLGLAEEIGKLCDSIKKTCFQTSKDYNVAAARRKEAEDKLNSMKTDRKKLDEQRLCLEDVFELVRKIANAKDDEDALKKALLSLEISLNNLMNVKTVFEHIQTLWEDLSFRCQILSNAVNAEGFVEDVKSLVKAWAAMREINIMGFAATRRVHKELCVLAHGAAADKEKREQLVQRYFAVIEVEKNQLHRGLEAVSGPARVTA